GHIAPVGADIGHAARGAVILSFDAPVEVGVVEEPVLRVGALDDQDVAKIAGLAHAAHLLNHGVIAQVVEGSVALAGAVGGGDHFARFGGGGGQRLFANHVLPGGEGVFGHGRVERVGGADVNGVDGFVFEDFAIVVAGPGDVELA